MHAVLVFPLFAASVILSVQRRRTKALAAFESIPGHIPGPSRRRGSPAMVFQFKSSGSHSSCSLPVSDHPSL